MNSLQTSDKFPIFAHLKNHLAIKGILKNSRIGWHCHLTDLTYIAVKTIRELGAELILSECNASTTGHDAVEGMRKVGATVYLGDDSTQKLLTHKPEVISDTGFALTTAFLAEKNFDLIGGCEITTSGITKLRQVKELGFPVINLNDGHLKSSIENFHGVGDGLIELLERLSPESFSGRKVAVLGYGQVGQGCAHYLKTIGANVSIVEINAPRALKAHYDGFAIEELSTALSTSKLIVTATGKEKLLSDNEWSLISDGSLVVNVGHFANELDLPSLRQMSSTNKAISPYVEEFTISGDDKLEAYKTSPRKIYIATEGHPANVVLLTGSPEATLIHLATEALALAYFLELNKAGKRLSPGEHQLPPSIEEEAALLALKALNLPHNCLQIGGQKCDNHAPGLESSRQTC